MHLSEKLSVFTITIIFICSLASVSFAADTLLDQAAAQYRNKDYAEATRLAKNAAASPQRTFLLGVAMLSMDQAGDSLPLLAEAESKLPLIGDYAALYQVEALLKLKRYPEAAAKAASIAKKYPTSLLIRRAEKYYADILYDAGNYAAALKAYQVFVEKYPAGSDSVDALYQLARCREETGDKDGSALIYRTIWLNNPMSGQSSKCRERLKELEKIGVKSLPYTSEELLRRAATLASQHAYSSALLVLRSIPIEGRTPSIAARIALRSGMACYGLRNWKEAEKNLVEASGSMLPGIGSKARFWLAKTLERQNKSEQAYEQYMDLADEGKKQEFADVALMEAAGLRRSQGRYREAARLFAQVATCFPKSKFISRAAWQSGWCHYLAGEYALAVEMFKPLLKVESMREKVTYWLARALENTGSGDADYYYHILLVGYPSGFYATWYRDQKGIRDMREPLGSRSAAVDLPRITGFDKPRLLALLGMTAESRTEMVAARKKAGDKKSLIPGLARTYLEMKDYRSAITLFIQNRSVKWDSASLPLWSAGYPLVYNAPVARYTATNKLSEGLIYALIRAESGFSPAIKSHVGAIGLMQLMPATAKAASGEKRTFNPQNLVIPDYNIRLGTSHFRGLLKAFDGEVVYSIAAYNAGTATVNRWRKGLKGLKKDEFIESIPYQETRDYVKKVYASAATYRQLYGLK
ncbi:MAG: transglycosylase SLT domain-containing protein [Geobacteraceae bacterium]|nr:transglycosylase SLT domain-containing protein [Geobacteraceae bacterium]